MNKIFFPNLNGIRFIAALFVIIHHIELIKHSLGYENKWPSPFIQIIGKLGVILFFVLSGFLITYLLLKEEEKAGKISIKEFYFRRMLRIWPLYYLIVGLSFFIFYRFPFLDLGEFSSHFQDNIGIKLFLFIFFLPNLASVMFPSLPYAGQTWSVGVEEQFYIMWPLLIKKVKNKKVLMLTIIVGYLLIKLAVFPFIKRFYWNNYLSVAESFWGSFSIDCMAIGGLFAVYLFNKEKILELLFSKYTQIIIYSLLIILIANGVIIPMVHYEFYGFLFGIIIINLAANVNLLLRLENKVFHYLGKISYGLYMFHPLTIVISIKLLSYLAITNSVIQYIFAILLTILISGISYRYFESYFIRKKIKYSVVLSGENTV